MTRIAYRVLAGEAALAALVYDGRAPQTAARREVISYDGSNAATVTITQDGTTTTCTLPLPRGRLSCQ